MSVFLYGEKGFSREKGKKHHVLIKKDKKLSIRVQDGGIE